MPSPWSDRLRGTTLRTRLTLWNTAVVIALTTTTLLAVRLAARDTLYANADAELRGAAREVALAIDELGDDESRLLSTLRRKAAGHEERGWFLQLLTVDGETIWTSDHCPADVVNFPPTDVERAETVRQVGPYRYVRTRANRPGSRPLLVRVGTYTTGLDRSLANLMRLLTGVSLALTAITPVAAWWLAGRATKPLGAMLHTAARLSPVRLGDRLPVSGTEDELDRLAGTINGLLDAVAHHVDQQEQFVADAAHELRGPLAALQSAMEVAISRENGSPGDHDALTDMLEAARHLSKVANDLLLLAEAGPGPRPTHHVLVDLGEVAGQTVAMFTGAAEEKGVRLSIDAGAATTVRGDPMDLRRLASNLLDNALGFTPRGGRVTVRVMPTADEVVMTVADDGQGIAPQDLNHVFDRFFKADVSRTHGGGRRSSGLGLAICRCIAENCGGTIAIASRLGEGTTVTVRLPSAAVAPSGHSVGPRADALARAAQPPQTAGR